MMKQPADDAANLESDPVDETNGETMTPEQLAENKRYNREDLTCDLIDKAIDIGFLALAAFIIARPLDQWLLDQWGLDNMWLRLAAMYLIVTLVHYVVSFPLSFYSGHRLEHKYGLSKQSLVQWLWRYLKSVSLTLVFGLVLTEGLFVVIALTGSYWWLAAAGTFFLVSVVLGQLAPVLILPLFYRVERFEDEVLGQRLERLAEGTGLSIEGIYRMALSEETVKANAMLAGLGSTRRVIMGDTLLDKFTEEEIEVVFAHEVGHHVHQHIRSLLLLGALFSVCGFLTCHLCVGIWLGNFHWSSEPPVFVLPMLTFVTTLFFLLTAPLQNAVSRHFKRQSDTYALQRTGNSTAYRSAFSKLARINKDDPEPHPLEVFWFHSHPPISERLAMADHNG